MNERNLTYDRHLPHRGSYAPTSVLAELGRCSDALSTIARIIGNNSQEPSENGAIPLPARAIAGLMSAAEIIAHHISMQIEEIWRATDSQQEVKNRGSERICG